MKRVFASALLLTLVACGQPKVTADTPLRLGFFPNITHAQALVGKTDGTFQKATHGKVEMHAFNAGPAAMEALLGGSLDMAYVGGGPALTAYVRSGGKLHVLAGAASGGSLLVVKKEITSTDQLDGKKLATPQLGNTQDVALRHFLRAHGMKDVALGEKGVQVLSMANADAFGQMKRGELDGAWVPEPWASRMIHEAGAHVLIDERDLWPQGTFPTTVLVATDEVMRTRPQLVQEILDAHRELSERWRKDPAAFAEVANKSFGELTQHPLKPEVLKDAFSRLKPETDPMAEQLQTLAKSSHELGYLPSEEVRGLVSAGSNPPEQRSE
ncbi:MAG: ABC transporter substrate-binding protein [Myxococcaceae bacterium]